MVLFFTNDNIEEMIPKLSGDCIVSYDAQLNLTKAKELAYEHGFFLEMLPNQTLRARWMFDERLNSCMKFTPPLSKNTKKPHDKNV